MTTKKLLVRRQIETGKVISQELIFDDETTTHNILENVPEIEEREGFRGYYVVSDTGEITIEYEEIPPTQIELLTQEVQTLKESQQVQDFLIDDIVFEVIPTLENQIATATSPSMAYTLLNKNIEKGSEGMAAYLAKKIIEGRDYKTVFRTNAYKQYQDEVDTILELEGRGDLIKR